MKVELKSIRSDIRNIQRSIAKDIIAEATVIAGTFYGIQRIADSINQFDYVIVDEAGQAIEPAIWSVAHFGKQLVLAGDDLQLPPTVKSREAQKMGLDKSLLQIAAEINFPKILLNVQYRMHHSIMGFSNEQFYEGQLIAHSSVKNEKLPHALHEPIEYIDTAGCSYEEDKDNESGGISNPGEVKVIQNILKEFDSEKHTIGIITPYRAQLNEIISTISNEKVNSNTIDSFQGQEQDIIIISLVRSNEKADIGFLKDYRRMNVAMTRAKMKLVVIGDSATIGQDKFYAAFLDYVEVHGSYRTAWEFQ
jgi:ATP-dependent RNA/DNA helicase IGHMBP2